MHGFAVKKVYFTRGTDVSLTARATADISNTNGYNHVKAYLSPFSENRLDVNSNCWTSGSSVRGSDAVLSYEGPGGSKRGTIVGSSSFVIPSSGYYNVVIYADAQTQQNGGESHTEIDNPSIRLVW